VVLFFEVVLEGKGEAMLFLPHEEGQGLLEYGLVLVLVAVIVAAVLLLLGPTIENLYSTVVNMWPE
jgi:pilus assembly protein Flp/PilA